MLIDYAGLRHIPGQQPRRWFHSQDEDLFVWYADDGAIFGFQLCYDKQATEKALTWLPHSGFSHNHIDSGEDKTVDRLLYKRTPVLVADGVVDVSALSQRFIQIAGKLPPDVLEFVCDKLQQYAQHKPKP